MKSFVRGLWDYELLSQLIYISLTSVYLTPKIYLAKTIKYDLPNLPKYVVKEHVINFIGLLKRRIGKKK